MTSSGPVSNGIADIDIDVSLPELPTSLKQISPYVQRAIELKKKDPIMCYWCLYYAVQQGVTVTTAKESRPFLLGAMTLLENTKVKIAAHSDAVSSDDAGRVYVEGFALRVFGGADNEDRNGLSTKMTAKKFLAAANFLEVLAVFGDSGQPESVTQKIRYSKWKAAEIAKAIREGRQPTPGPAGSLFEGLLDPVLSVPTSPQLAAASNGDLVGPPPQISIQNDGIGSVPNAVPLPVSSDSELTPYSSPKARSKALSPERGASAVQKRSISPAGGPGVATPPAVTVSPRGNTRTHSRDPSGTDEEVFSVPHTPNQRLTPGGGPSPAAWSTQATPGLDSRWNTPAAGAKGDSHSRSGSESSLNGTKAVKSDPARIPAPKLSALENAKDPRRGESGQPSHRDGDQGSSSSKTLSDSEEDPQRHGLANAKALGDRKESWSSTMADRGGSLGPSRASSMTLPSPATAGSLGPSTFPGEKQAGLDAIPESSSPVAEIEGFNLPALPPSSTGGDHDLVLPSAPTLDDLRSGKDFVGDHDAEAADVVTSLPTLPVSAPVRKVHWTPSVVGGLSSVGGDDESVATSPGAVGSSIPLPDSTDEGSGSGDLDDGALHSTPVEYHGPFSSRPEDRSPMERFDVVSSPFPGRLPPLAPTPTVAPTTLNTSLASPSINPGRGSTPSGRGRGLSLGGNVPPITAATPILSSAPPLPTTSSNPSLRAPAPASSITPSTPSSATLATTLPLPDAIDPEETMRAKRHAKFAMSALDFDDLETARRELVRALGVLGVEVHLS